MQTTATVPPSEREREQLENKMREVFGDEMKKLDKEMQSMLADDIVTAFLNRIGLFIKIEGKKRRYTRTRRSLNP